MKPIRIIGGGLAGLTLGIALRQRGVPAQVIEAARYPRHRVCGEFISGRGRHVLRELGLEETLLGLGASDAATAAFYAPRAYGFGRALPEPALCLSRFQLDAALAEEFRRLGGDLRENVRWKGALEEGAVRATGRRPALAGGRWRWFALKAHAKGVSLAADLEMHLLDDGYIGLCRLSEGCVNVCGLFRRPGAVPDLARDWRRFLMGPPGSVLHQRLASAEFLPETFCAVAGLDPVPHQIGAGTECSLGDAITMAPPITGNGMSMAFESARLAAENLGAYARGGLSWSEAVVETGGAHRRAFRRRFFWGSLLHRTAFARPICEAAVQLGAHFPPLWRQLFLRTR